MFKGTQTTIRPGGDDLDDEIVAVTRSPSGSSPAARRPAQRRQLWAALFRRCTLSRRRPERRVPLAVWLARGRWRPGVMAGEGQGDARTLFRDVIAEYERLLPSEFPSRTAPLSARDKSSCPRFVSSRPARRSAISCSARAFRIDEAAVRRSARCARRADRRQEKRGSAAQEPGRRPTSSGSRRTAANNGGPRHAATTWAMRTATCRTSGLETLSILRRRAHRRTREGERAIFNRFKTCRRSTPPAIAAPEQEEVAAELGCWRSPRRGSRTTPSTDRRSGPGGPARRQGGRPSAGVGPRRRHRCSPTADARRRY